MYLHRLTDGTWEGTITLYGLHHIYRGATRSAVWRQLRTLFYAPRPR